jgi:hypothetical protein
VVQLIATWNTPVDGGGGNPGRNYQSPPVGAGWTNLEANVAYSVNWSGAFRISGESAYWFNRFPQPPSPFLALDPQPAYITTATDVMQWQTNNGGAGASCSFQLLGDPATPSTFCQYGTRLKSTSSFVYYLTPGLIDTWLAAIGAAALAPLFTAFWFSTLDARAVCGSQPPQVPPVQLGSLSDTIDTLRQYLYVVAWPSLCECVPGTPPPTAVPPPGLSAPTGFPTLPVLSCANTDLCAALVQIQQQLLALSNNLENELTLTTLLQRYTLPFAVVPGATHSGLSGTGSFRVDRLKGLRVSITSNPGTGTLPGNPIYVKDQGWISVSDASQVFIQERRVSQSTFDWFPREMQMAELVGFEFFPGVIASIQELQAET